MRFLVFLLTAAILLTSVPGMTAERRTGPVRASGKALRDDQGEFHALGATMMWALWAYKNDRAWLDRNLQFLADRGFHYIRALGVIDREIETDPDAFWYRFHMAMNWPDYDQMIAGLTDHVYDQFGMRIEWTIFGGAFDFNESQKGELIDKFIRMSKGREHKILHFEVANELHGTGWKGDDGSAKLRGWTKYLNDRTDILVAGSSPYGDDMCGEMQKIYNGGVADIGTWHFDRDVTKGDGYWRPVRQSWEYAYCDGLPAIGSNNEPLGPGSTNGSDTDPMTNVGNAIVSYISGLPLHVYHGEFGVRAEYGDYTQYYPNVTSSFLAMTKYIPPDVTNWSRQNHHWAGHPFISNGEIGYPPARGSGAVRNYAAVKGNDFISFPMGVRDYLSITAKNNTKFCVIHPLTGQLMDRVSLKAGESFELRGLTAFVLKGKINSDNDGCEGDGPGPEGYLGCYTDRPDRALPVLLSSGGETVESCRQKAGSAGYAYAGVQWYGECHAGNTVGYQRVSDSECNTPCNANPDEMCGGGWRNSVYRAEEARPTPTDYMGCYTDRPDRALQVLLSSGGETVESCRQKAGSAGYAYAGVQWYGECHAGNTVGYQRVSDSECNTPCNANPSEMCGGGWRNSIYRAASSPKPDNSLRPGDSWESPDGRFQLAYQSDGNLVLYQKGVGPLWASHTAGTSPRETVMQGDGNLVIYDGSGTPVWASGTAGNPGARLHVQPDGNVVIYSAGGGALWSTGTCCR